MKTITKILIAVLICSMFLTYLPMQAQSTSTLTIEATEMGVTDNSLKNAASIIKARLEEYTGKKASCTVNGEQKRIRITFSGDVGDQLLAYLITEKGEVNFYEVARINELKNESAPIASLESLSDNTRANEWSLCFSKEQLKASINQIQSTVWADSVKPAWSYPDFQCCYFLKVKKGLSPALAENSVEKSSWEPSRDKHAVINIRFRPDQVKAWSYLTRRNLNRVLAICMDGKVLSAPMVRSVIDGGNCIITGSFDNREAACISSMVGHGALPVNFRIVE